MVLVLVIIPVLVKEPVLIIFSEKLICVMLAQIGQHENLKALPSQDVTFPYGVGAGFGTFSPVSESKQYDFCILGFDQLIMKILPTQKKTPIWLSWSFCCFVSNSALPLPSKDHPTYIGSCLVRQKGFEGMLLF